MRKKTLFLSFFFFLVLTGAHAATGSNLEGLLSPNVPIEAIPPGLKLPDAVIPFLKTEFYNTIGKNGSFDTQFKIVFVTGRITNTTMERYDFLVDIVSYEVKNSAKTAQKNTSVSPDARVLAISTIAESSNSNYVPAMLSVIERDEALKPRIAAARILTTLGNGDLIVPKLLDLLKNQYGSSRAKFDESDSKRYDDDRVAQAIIETLGDVGDARAFPVLLQTVMSPDKHRDDTIKAGWDAIKKLKW